MSLFRTFETKALLRFYSIRRYEESLESTLRFRLSRHRAATHSLSRRLRRTASEALRNRNRESLPRRYV